MKLKIVIIGSKVHDVGYRVFLLKHAMNLAIPGFTVYNWTEDGQQQVIALAEADEGKIAAFKQVATEKRPELAKVSDVTFEPYDGEIGRTSELAMYCSFVQLDKAIPELLGIRENMRALVEGQSEIRENTRALVDMQSEMIDEIRGLREDLVGSREWQRRIEHDIQVIKAKLRIQ
jgi:acylphosphatase